MTWQKYCDECKRLNIVNPYQDEKTFNRAYEIREEYEPFIARKSVSAKKVEPTLENHETIPKKQKVIKPKKIKAVKPPKEKKEPYRRQKIYTDEEIKQRRAEARRKKRAENAMKGLTVDGKQRAEKKPSKTIEEIRKDRLKYAMNWRNKNREKHLAYRRELYQRSKNDS